MKKVTSFKKFFIESLTPSTKISTSRNDISSKWDVILFYGEYNPITKKEINTIKEFIKNFNINKNVQIGLITNDLINVDSNYYIKKKINYELTFEEKKYITTKFFGLKLFGFDLEKVIDLLNLKKIYKVENNQKNIIDNNKSINYQNKYFFLGNNEKQLPLDINDKNKDDIIKDINIALKEYIDKFIFLFKNNFYSNNILIVMPKEDFINIDELMDITEFTSDKINLGFTFWNYKNNIMNDESYKIFGNFLPITGDMIKAIVLLNYEKPNPENLRNFCHKYKISHLFNEIKNIHFKLNNDNYYLAFDYLFPEININSYNKDIDLETKKTNLLFIMEMLKEMYIKDL